MMYTMMNPMARSFTRSLMDLADPMFNELRPSFSVDVRKTEDGWQLTADLPGVKQEDIDISLENDLLTVSATFGSEEKTAENGYTRVERRSGRFSRSFTVEDVDQDSISASYTDGVLTLTLPRIKEQKPDVRHIAITGPVDTVA